MNQCVLCEEEPAVTSVKGLSGLEHPVGEKCAAEIRWAEIESFRDVLRQIRELPK